MTAPTFRDAEDGRRVWWQDEDGTQGSGVLRSYSTAFTTARVELPNGEEVAVARDLLHLVEDGR